MHVFTYTHVFFFHMHIRTCIYTHAYYLYVAWNTWRACHRRCWYMPTHTYIHTYIPTDGMKYVKSSPMTNCWYKYTHIHTYIHTHRWYEVREELLNDELLTDCGIVEILESARAELMDAFGSISNCLCVSVCLCVRVCMRMYVCMYVCEWNVIASASVELMDTFGSISYCLGVSVSMCLHVYVCICSASLCACMYMCAYVCVCEWDAIESARAEWMDAFGSISNCLCVSVCLCVHECISAYVCMSVNAILLNQRVLS